MDAERTGKLLCNCAAAELGLGRPQPALDHCQMACVVSAMVQV